MHSFYFHHSEQTKHLDLSTFEKQLGDGAKLGLSFYLIDKDGKIITEEGHRSHEALPMASTKKIAIALTILKRVFHENTLALNDNITLDEQDFSPGPPTNPLDQYFFNLSGNYPQQTRTINDLLILMLTKSDNTACDKLLSLAGGQSEINKLMSELGIKTYKITRNCKQLLGDYYGITPTKSKQNCELFLKELATVFVKREIENTMFTSGDDCCSPRDMSELLRQLYCSSINNDNSWLTTAAKHILEIMKNCTTGENRIRKAIADIPDVVYVGNKTGSLGGIANDTALIKFQNGQCAIITISTCLSPLLLQERESIIVKAAKLVMNQVKDLQPVRSYIYRPN